MGAAVTPAIAAPWLMLFAAPAERRPRSVIDEELVERARRGDRQSFREIYRRHADVVWQRLTRILGADPDREDLLQQVFMDLHRALPSFRGDAALSTFIYRLVVNVAVDHLRRVKRRRSVRLLPEHEASLRSPDEGPESAARRRDELTRVLAAVGRLKPKKRVAFLLRFVEGLALDEIADIVGASPDTVRKRIDHATAEVTAMLARMEQRR